MKWKFLYLIIYMALFGGLCGCERLDIPNPNEGTEDIEKEEEENKTPLPDPDNKDEVRDGSREAPYTVAHTQAIGYDYFELEDVWVEGYIVGWISGSHYQNGARFTSKAAGQTNLLLADSIHEIDPAHCIPVQLPANTRLREELNLADNPQHHRRHIKLKGDITSYFSTTGIKNPTIYEWMGTSAIEDEKTALSVTEIYEDFSGFKIGDSLSLKNWSISAPYTPNWQIGGNPLERYATICHTDTFSNRPFDYWLITPPINLNRMKDAVFSFSTAYDNWDGNSRLEAFILSEKNPYEVGLLPVLDAPIAQPGTSEPNQWLHSGDISLHSYAGILYIGFRLEGRSTGERGTEYRIDNIRLEEKTE